MDLLTYLLSELLQSTDLLWSNRENAAIYVNITFDILSFKKGNKIRRRF